MRGPWRISILLIRARGEIQNIVGVHPILDIDHRGTDCEGRRIFSVWLH